jgi:hypothetical protein
LPDVRTGDQIACNKINIESLLNAYAVFILRTAGFAFSLLRAAHPAFD